MNPLISSSNQEEYSQTYICSVTGNLTSLSRVVLDCGNGSSHEFDSLNEFSYEGTCYFVADE